MADTHDKLLPIANVGRIMKLILPPNAKVSREAKESMQECASEFISFVTGEASDKCHKENRKTVNGDDICWALSSLGFDNYNEAMLRYLHRFREYEKEKANHGNKANSRRNNENQEDEVFTIIGCKEMSESTASNPSVNFQILEMGATSNCTNKPN